MNKGLFADTKYPGDFPDVELISANRFNQDLFIQSQLKWKALKSNVICWLQLSQNHLFKYDV